MLRWDPCFLGGGAQIDVPCISYFFCVYVLCLKIISLSVDISHQVCTCHKASPKYCICMFIHLVYHCQCESRWHLTASCSWNPILYDPYLFGKVGPFKWKAKASTCRSVGIKSVSFNLKMMVFLLASRESNSKMTQQVSVPVVGQTYLHIHSYHWFSNCIFQHVCTIDF